MVLQQGEKSHSTETQIKEQDSFKCQEEKQIGNAFEIEGSYHAVVEEVFPDDILTLYPKYRRKNLFEIF